MCDIKDCYLSEVGFWVNKAKHQFRRNIIMPSFCSVKYLKEQRSNYGIFKTTYSYDTYEQNKANLYGDLYLDFDSTDFELVRLDALKALSYLKIVFKINIEEDCLIFFSGGKGAHIIIPAETLGVEPNKALNETYKIIAETLFEYTDNSTIDLKIYDKKRMFRIPNSIHEVSGLHKVNITLEELRHSSYESIKEIAKHQRPIKSVNRKFNSTANKMLNSFQIKADEKTLSYKNIKSTGTLKYEPPCIKEILEQGALNGQRNNTVAVVASYFKACGNDMDEATNKIKKWNEEKTGQSLSEFELLRTIQSIYSSDMQFGCSSINALGLCSKEYCKFKK